MRNLVIPLILLLSLLFSGCVGIPRNGYKECVVTMSEFMDKKIQGIQGIETDFYTFTIPHRLTLTVWWELYEDGSLRPDISGYWFRWNTKGGSGANDKTSFIFLRKDPDILTGKKTDTGVWAIQEYWDEIYEGVKLDKDPYKGGSSSEKYFVNDRMKIPLGRPVLLYRYLVSQKEHVNYNSTKSELIRKYKYAFFIYARLDTWDKSLGCLGGGMGGIENTKHPLVQGRKLEKYKNPHLRKGLSLSLIQPDGPFTFDKPIPIKAVFKNTGSEPIEANAFLPERGYINWLLGKGKIKDGWLGSETGFHIKRLSERKKDSDILYRGIHTMRKPELLTLEPGEIREFTFDLHTIRYSEGDMIEGTGTYRISVYFHSWTHCDDKNFVYKVESNKIVVNITDK